jgi:urease accessory protein UreE
MIGWTTITYRSVIMLILGIVLLAAGATYFIFPNQVKSMFDAAQKQLSKWAGTPQPAQQIKAGPQQANFTAIEGSVRVKKASSNTWVNAEQTTALEKGDVVQTAGDGIARINFADGSNYVVKPDSLIVIEENSMNQAQQTNVSVQVTTGTVDLATATYTSGSKSGVTVAGATATLSPDSSAQVRSDPKADSFSVLAKKGSLDVTRNGETLKLSDYDKVAFASDSKTMVRTKELAPPTLINPANMLPLFSPPNQPKPVEFSWSPVKGATMYHIKISQNAYFTSNVTEKKVPTTQYHETGLAEGAYYWLVTSIDAKGKESVESEKNRFTVVAKSGESATLPLDVQPFVQHGHILEIRGKTESGARVMVNGEEVPNVDPDGSFMFFTHPLPDGENTITITAQNTRGGVKTKQQQVVIQ